MKLDLISLLVRHTKKYDVEKTEQSAKIISEKAAETPFIKCRQLVALIGFVVYVFISTHRMNMTISIVEMVKPHRIANLNASLDSCPAPRNELNHTASTLSNEVSGGFDWTPQIQGYVLGSSFVGYFLTQFVGGKYAEIFGCKWIIFWGIFIASVTTLMTPFAAWSSIYVLILVQTLRGMAQGMLQSSVSVLAANWFPVTERGSLYAFMMAGSGAGVFVGGLVTGYLCHIPSGGWPSVFYSCGTAGVLFSLVIARFLYESPSVHPTITETELKFILSNQECKMTQKRPKTPWRYMVTSVPVYALSFAIFGQVWGGTHFLAIQPTFMGTILHFPIAQNGLLVSSPFLLQTVFTLVASGISQIMSKHGCVRVNTLRKFWNFWACLGYSSCLMGIYFAKCDKFMSVAFSCISAACLGFAYTGSMIVAADMTPVFAGSVMGLSSTIGSTASFILPIITGHLTEGKQTIEQWDKILFISIGVVMSSGISFCLFGSAEVQSWNYTEDKNVDDSAKQTTNC